VTASRPRVWFLDTSSLLSIAVHSDIEAAVLDAIGGDRVVIIDIVQDELSRRASIPETAGLAKTALACIKPHWTVMDTTPYVTLEDVQLAQEDVADGRTWPGARQGYGPPPHVKPGSPKARELAPPATSPGQVKSVQSRHWGLLVTRTQVCTPVGAFQSACDTVVGYPLVFVSRQLCIRFATVLYSMGEPVGSAWATMTQSKLSRGEPVAIA